MEEEVILASEAWVNSGGMILITIGVAFIILEFFLPSFGLFGFAGASSILIGVVQLHQTGYIEEMPVSIDTLIIMAIIGLLLAAAGGLYTYRLYQKQNTTGTEAMLGQEATIIDWKDTKGNIHIQGENWQAYSDDKYSLNKGDKVLVSKIDGLKIKISHTESDE